MSVRIENLDKDVIVEEDNLLGDFRKLSFYEDEAQKREAASEGEDEAGGLEVKNVGSTRERKYTAIRSYGTSGRRSWMDGELSRGTFEQRKKSIQKNFKSLQPSKTQGFTNLRDTMLLNCVLKDLVGEEN
mgnify:CR=1 FL=1